MLLFTIQNTLSLDPHLDLYDFCVQKWAKKGGAHGGTRGHMRRHLEGQKWGAHGKTRREHEATRGGTSWTESPVFCYGVLVLDLVSVHFCVGPGFWIASLQRRSW